MGAMRRRAAGLVMACGLLVGACQTTGFGGSGSGDARLRTASEDYRDTVTQGVLIGAAGGAALGAIIGGLTGGGRGALNGALIGTLAGGVVGGVSGKAVADDKAGYAAAEDQLDAEIAAARRANAKLSNLVSITSSLVDKRRREVAAIDMSSSDSAVAARKAELQRIRADRAELDKAIRAAESKRDEVAKLANGYQGAGGGALAGANAQTESHIARLKSNRERLDSLGGRLE